MQYVLPWGKNLPNRINLLSTNLEILPFNKSRVKASERIGPHNSIILDIQIGSLLGDGWAEKRIGATRLHIHVSAKNVEYIMWLHKILAIQGYCNPNKPKINKQIGKNNKIYYSIKIRTWSFTSQNYIYEAFYKNRIKIIPSYEFLMDHLTPLALAIWVMDDGSKDGSGIRISTNCFKKEEILILLKVLKDKYDITANLRQQFVISIPKKEMVKFHEIIVKSMLGK